VVVRKGRTNYRHSLVEGLYPKQDVTITPSNRKISNERNESNLRCPFLQLSDESLALVTVLVVHWRHPQQLRQKARMDGLGRRDTMV